MKKIKQKQLNAVLKTALVSLSATFLFFTACKKGNPRENELDAIDSKMSATTTQAVLATPNSALIAYKASNHQISAGFFRMFKDVSNGGATSLANFSNVPDSLDIAIAFVFNSAAQTVKNTMKNTYIPALHAKGTKVLVTGKLDIPTGVTHDAAGYAKTAKLIMDSTVNKYGFDGFDIDVEFNPTGATLTDMVGVYKALSVYLGPKSGTGKLLTFDTNQNGNNNMFQQVYTLIDLVWLQVYGQSATNLQSRWDTFSAYIPASKFVPGFSFYEENGYPSNYWDDVIYPRNGTGRSYDMARWQPVGTKKGGLFSYAIDRDCNLTSNRDNTERVPDYRVTNDLIQIMNPANTGTGSTNAVSLSSGSIDGGNVTQLNGASKFTVEAWVKFNSTGAWSTVLAKSTTNTNRIALQTGYGDGSLYAIVGNGSNSYGYTAANVVTAGQWYHVAIVFDGTQSSNANKLKLYVNATQQTLTFSGTIPSSVSTSNTAAFLTGKETAGSTSTYLAGTIDEVRVWNQALTQSTLSTWKDKALGSCHANYSGLALYWPLDNTASAAVAGLTTTYTGVITNGTYVSSTQASFANGCP